MSEEHTTHAELPEEVKALAAQCNEKHVRVVQAILSGEYPSNTKAYMSVYTDAMQEAANASVARMLAIGSVKALYNALREVMLLEGALSRSEAISILSDMARTGMGDLVTFSTTSGLTNEDGEPTVQSVWAFKDSDNMTQAQLRSIQELNATRDGLKIKQHDQKAAIKQLSDMLGWNEPSKIEVTNLEVAGDILYKK